MRIVVLPLPLELEDKNPYFIFGRYQAEAEIRAALAEAYAFTHDRYRTTHMGGMVRWAEATENLARATERFGTRVINRGGQRRLCWPGLGGESAEIIVLRGRPMGDRVDTSERGIRSEEHSQLHLMSFPTESGEAMTTGSYLFHDRADEHGWGEAWFAAQGRTHEGWDHVLCEELVSLGRFRYLALDGDEDEPVDVRP